MYCKPFCMTMYASIRWIKCLSVCVLFQYGKDFESIHNLILTKCKKKNNTMSGTFKNKEQVRHFYYRTWHKISKLIQPVKGEFDIALNILIL